MRVLKFAKFLFIGLAGLAGLFILLTLGLNLYLQSAGVQEKMRDATERSIGLPVQIRGASYTPWTGLTLKALSAGNPSGKGANVLDAKALNFRVALLPLLSRRVVVTSVTLVDPAFRIPADMTSFSPPATKRKFPAITKAAPVVEKPSPLPVPEPDGEAAAGQLPGQPLSTSEPSAPSPPAAQQRRPGFAVEIHQFGVRDGKVIMERGSGRPEAHMEGVFLETRITSGNEQSGLFEAASASLENSMRIEKIRAPFRHSRGRFEAADFRAEWAGGSVTGNFSIDESSRVLVADSVVEGVEISRVLLDAGIPPGRSGGTLRGSLQIEGPSDRRELLVGGGSFELVDARIEPVNFIRQVGGVLGIEELQLLELREAVIQVAIEEGVFALRVLRFRTDNFIFWAEGIIGDGGKLDLDARIHIAEPLLARAGSFLTQRFTPSGEEGYRGVAFEIGGTVRNPETDLLEKITGARIDKEVGRFLNTLFGQPTRKKQDSGDSR